MLKHKITKKYPAIVLLLVFFIVLVIGASITCSHAQINLNNDDSTLNFAQLSDTHIDLACPSNSARMLGESKALLSDAINQLNSLRGLDFVIFSGDLINKPIESYFTTFLDTVNNLKSPWYLVMGNHDIGIDSSFNKSRFLELYRKYNKNFKSSLPYYSFEPKKGYVVIVMDGVIDSKITANGYFYPQELQWLEATLDEYNNSEAIIVQHFPIVEPYKSSDHKVKNAKKYLAILKKHKNVLLVLSGHYHATKITKIDNIIHVSTPALVQYPNAFRLITIDNKTNQIAVNFKFMETGLKEIQQKSLENSHSPSLSAGEEKDRNTTILIVK